MLTVFNTAEEAREVELRVQIDRIAGRPVDRPLLTAAAEDGGQVRARRLVTGGQVEGDPVKLSLPPRGFEVLEVRSGP